MIKIIKGIFILTTLLMFIMITGCNESLYTVKYIDYDDTIIKIDKVKVLEDATPPSDPQRKGYTFIGWDHDDHNVISDLEIKALYENNEYIIITMNSGLMDTLLVNYDEDVTLPTPTKRGHRFLGWYYQDQLLTSPFKYIYDENITLIAKWEEWVDPLYNETLAFIEEADALIISAENFRVKSHINIDYSITGLASGSSYIDSTMIISPLNNYIDTEIIQDGKFLERTIIQKVEDETLLTNLYPRTGKPTLYQSEKIEEYVFESDYTINGDDFFHSSLQYTKLADGHYKIDLSFSDILDYLVGLEEFYQSLGIDPNVYKNLDLSMEIMMSSDKKLLQQNINMNQKIDIEGKEVNVIYQIIITYDLFNESEMINLNSSDYEKIIPDTFEKVGELIDLSLPINTTQAPQPHFYKAYFEKGQYIIESPILYDLEIEIYDINQNKIELGKLWFSYSHYKNYTFTIESGTYYIKMNRNLNLTDGYQFQFKRLNFQTVLDLKPLSINDTVYGSSEGAYDYDIYQYYSETSGTLLISETNPQLTFLSIDYSGGIQLEPYLKYEGYYFIPILPGVNELYVSANENIDYNFKTEFFADKDSSFENTEILTDSFSTDYVVAGYFNSPDFFTITALEAGQYTIEYLKCTQIFQPSATFYTSDKLYMPNRNTAYLNPGTYYVKIDSNQHIPVVAKVRYSFQKDVIETKPFTVLDYDGTTLFNGTMPLTEINDSIKTRYSKIYHQFTLTDESWILIGSIYDYELLDESSNNLKLNLDEYGQYYKLGAGTYRIRIIWPDYLSPLSHYNIKIGRIITDIPDDYQYPVNITSLPINTEISITYNFSGDVDVFVFNVTQTQIYYIDINHVNVYILDSQKKQYAFFHGFQSFVEEQVFISGTYYFVVSYFNDTIPITGTLIVKDRIS